MGLLRVRVRNRNSVKPRLGVRVRAIGTRVRVGVRVVE